MIVAEFPLNEQQRLEDLYSFFILDTGPDANFDNLSVLATQIYKCPISLITFIDKDRQWFKSNEGIDQRQTSRDFSFCAHTILNNEVMVVGDTKEDIRFHDNPLVVGYPHIRFYAGAPIVSNAGYHLGTICILDYMPRYLSRLQMNVLSLLSKQVSLLMEVKRHNESILHRNAVVEFIEETEAKMKHISNQLHESIAQQLASCKMFLKMATEHPERSQTFIHSVTQQLTLILREICYLSYSVAPQLKPWIDTSETIAAHIKGITHAFPFTTKLSTTSNSQSCDASIVLAVLRVMEHWLNKLAKKKDVTVVHIHILAELNLQVDIFDDGDIAFPTERHREIMEHILCEHLHSLSGYIKITTLGSQNVLRIFAPIIASEKM